MPELIVIAGESHAGCVTKAATSRSRPHTYRTAKWRENVVGDYPSITLPDGSEVVHPGVLPGLAEARGERPRGSVVVLSVFGGNFGNRLSMLSSGRTLTLASGVERMEDLKLSQQQFVPESLGRRMIDHMSRQLDIVLSAIKQDGYDVIHVEGPPPVRDDDYVLSKLPMKKIDTVKRTLRVREVRVTPHGQRLAFYRHQCAAARAICERLGMTYLPPPSDAVDAEGYLAEPYLHDAAHANVAYGELVLRDVEKRIGSQ